MKRLVLMVEGAGDKAAAPPLINRVLQTMNVSSPFFIDDNVIEVGGLEKLARKDFHFWKRMLGVAQKRGNLGGVILLLDGDSATFEGAPFCAATAARRLAEEASSAGAAPDFCAAIVFALREYESWLLAGIHGAAGQILPQGRGPVPSSIAPPEGNLEENPRDAKGWLNTHLPFGYRPTLDQAALTRAIDLDAVRTRMRSFRRLENAVESLVQNIRDETHIVSPSREFDAR